MPVSKIFFSLNDGKGGFLGDVNELLFLCFVSGLGLGPLGGVLNGIVI